MSHEEVSIPKGLMVVGVDGSPASLAALRWAGENAPLLNMAIEAICIWDNISFATDLLAVGFGSSGVVDTTDAENIAKRIVESAAAEIFPDARPHDLQLNTYEGGATEVFLEKSTSAQMLVLGSRGHGAIADLFLGSVSNSCSAKAKCPVLVVH